MTIGELDAKCGQLALSHVFAVNLLTHVALLCTVSHEVLHVLARQLCSHVANPGVNNLTELDKVLPACTLGSRKFYIHFFTLLLKYTIHCSYCRPT
jgi:hypothetical protein